MRKPTYYLAALVGVLVAAGVWCWPEGPLWQTGPGAGRNAGFSPDGRVFVTHGFWSRDESLHVSRWDARTGRLLSRAEMACDKPTDRFDLRRALPSPDGTLVLVGQGVPPANNSGMVELWTGDWFVHDGRTGRRILGPIEGVNYIGLESFSADNRWFAAYRGEARSGVQHRDQLGIYSTETGKCIKELSQGVYHYGFCRFAPDGNSVAVSWWANSTEGGKQPLPQATVREVSGSANSKASDKPPTIVEIFELPSAHLRRRVEFPCEYIVVNWDGRFLTAVKYDRGPPNTSSQIIFDVEQNPLGDGQTDPLLRDYVDSTGTKVHWQYQSGRHWVAHFTSIAPGARRPGIAGWLDWLTLRLGVGPDWSKERRVTVRMIDRISGATRYEIPRPVKLSLRFSDDGKLLACGEGFIEVWDTDPPPRWPKAIAWGIIAAGTLSILGRWRRRSSMPSSPTRSPLVSARP